MAIFLLVSVSSYARPSELIRVLTHCLVKPSKNITQCWSLLLCPEERHHRTKTGEFDTSILLDSPWMSTWAPNLFSVLKEAPPDQRLWDFNYVDYEKAFRKAAEVLDLEVTPYQTRHSGPSIDRVKGYRTLPEVQKRGQWKSHKSVARYEKAARLASTWEALPEDLRLHCLDCEENLGAYLLKRRPLPTFRGSSGSQADM